MEHATKVQNDQIAGSQNPITGPVMRHGRVLAGGDDGIKRGFVEPDPSQLSFDQGRNITLWPGETFRFYESTRKLDPAEYEWVTASAAAPVRRIRCFASPRTS